MPGDDTQEVCVNAKSFALHTHTVTRNAMRMKLLHELNCTRSHVCGEHRQEEKGVAGRRRNGVNRQGNQRVPCNRRCHRSTRAPVREGRTASAMSSRSTRSASNSVRSEPRTWAIRLIRSTRKGRRAPNKPGTDERRQSWSTMLTARICSLQLEAEID